ncbi:MAG: hypothetical protein AB7R89_05500 [Dehalococcoidia bacterium]
MPNGGVPLHMAIRPRDGSVVLYCRGASLFVVPWAEWEQHPGPEGAICTLDAEEARVLTRFLRYWLQDSGEGPIYPPGASGRHSLGEATESTGEMDVLFDY